MLGHGSVRIVVGLKLTAAPERALQLPAIHQEFNDTKVFECMPQFPT